MPRGKGRGCGEAACTRQDGEEDLGFLDFENKNHSTSEAASFFVRQAQKLFVISISTKHNQNIFNMTEILEDCAKINVLVLSESKSGCHIACGERGGNGSIYVIKSES